MAKLDERLIARFWAKVDIGDSGDCWEWQGFRKPPQGHGSFAAGVGQSPLNAHRLAYEIANGPIPSGLHVCHRCDNPPCCNPAHLFLGTPRDNQVDCSQKGRRRTVLNPWSATGVFARLLMDITQEQAAEEYHVSRGTVKSIWRGNSWCHLFETGPCGEENRIREAKPIRWRRGGADVCPNGHPWTEDNLALDQKGRRFCRECHRIRNRESARRLRLLAKQNT